MVCQANTLHIIELDTALERHEPNSKGRENSKESQNTINFHAKALKAVNRRNTQLLCY